MVPRALPFLRRFSVFIWKGLHVDSLVGKGEREEGRRLAGLSGSCLPGETLYFLRLCVYLG